MIIDETKFRKHKSRVVPDSKLNRVRQNLKVITKARGEGVTWQSIAEALGDLDPKLVQKYVRLFAGDAPSKPNKSPPASPGDSPGNPPPKSPGDSPRESPSTSPRVSPGNPPFISPRESPSTSPSIESKKQLNQMVSDDVFISPHVQHALKNLQTGNDYARDAAIREQQNKK